ncbi:MAG: hypothetical protein COT06_07280 [Syntrophobacteraceae bacterium CG07_land_8_20_14_0_80_61_8]|nr:MAG: hypothetical protein COT06_07280 [Syntrophobacteraceae bacterium CG07_land_8_20_14_0_80_61_8]
MQAKKRAADEGRTLTALVEDGLMLVLATAATKSRERIVLPVSKAVVGTLPGIDLNSSSDLEEIMNAS